MKLSRRLAVQLFASLMACLFLVQASGARQPPGDETNHQCYIEYTETQGTILGEILAPGSSKVRAHISQAWGRFWQQQPISSVNERIDSALTILASNAIHGATPESKAIAEEVILEFRACVNGEDPGNTAQVNLSIYMLDETAPDLRGDPAGAGVRIYVDNQFVTLTNDNGQASFEVPAGEFELMAVIPSTAIATTGVSINAGETRNIELILDDSKEVVFPATAVVSSMIGDLLPYNFTTFEIQLFNSGVHRPIEYISEIAIEDDIGNLLLPLSDSFAVDPNGNMLPADVAALSAALAPYRGRELVLKAEGEDSIGFTLTARKKLFIASYGLQVQLVVPPSNPALALGSIEVSYELMGTSLSLHRTSDAAGSASFGLVPFGNTTVTAHTSQGGRDYYGQAVYFANQGSKVFMVMRHAEDVEAGVPPYHIEPLTGSAAAASAPGTVEFPTRSVDPTATASLPAALVSPTAVTETLRVSAGQMNVNVYGSRTLVAPQGSPRLYLRYRVSTAEYPTYVMQQSVFNDTWSLNLLARQSGQQFYGISRNVNSQLTNAPAWRADGTTGFIEQSYDISALTAAGETEIVISASAMNVGDSLLPTIVDAEISVDEERLVVSDVRAEQLANARNHETFSMPLLNETNGLHRWFLMNVDVPDGATITRVKAEILGSSNAVLSTLYDEAPGANVQMPSATVLRARVTRVTPSTLNTVAPPAHNITYRFIVYANSAEGQEISGEGSSRIMRALWRMQAYWRDPARRYGIRDPGHDDWLSARTWEYLQNHGNLLTRIDDISGEHGRNIEHDTHDVGTDIDLYHTFTFAGAISGGDNHNRLRNAVIRALALPAEQTIQDRADITAWVNTTRQRFSAVLTTTDAQRIYYSIGNAHAAQGIALPRGWARALLVNGALTASGTTFNTGLGPWGFDQTRLTYNAVHNSHWHVARPRDR